jgi:hypothetical protein
MRISQRLRIAALALMAASSLAWSPPAHADCTSPAGEESRTIYDFTTHVMKICNGTSWLSMSGGESSSGTAGYIQFSNGSGGFSSDSTAGGQLYWDSINHRLGIATAIPASTLEVTGNISANKTSATLEVSRSSGSSNDLDTAPV